MRRDSTSRSVDGVEVRTQIDGIEQILDGLPEEEPVRHVVQMRGDFLEALVAVARRGAGREAVHSAAMASTFSCRSMREPSSKKQRHCGSSRHEVEIVVQVAPGFGEDALEHARHGEDRRPHVEAEAAFVQHRRLAAEPGVLVVEGDPVAARRADAGGRQSPEPAADDRDRNCPSLHAVLLPISVTVVSSCAHGTFLESAACRCGSGCFTEWICRAYESC